MSAPNEPTAEPTPAETEGWTEADREAVLASAFWFSANATPELIAPYRGMHVAILGEQIIDADRDPDKLCSRIAAQSDTVPFYRVLVRYVPTEEEAWRGHR